MSAPLDGDPFSEGSGIGVAEPSRVSTLTAWIMTALTAGALTVAIVGRLFPLALVLDVVALWPLPALALVLVLLGRWLPRSVRLAAPALLVSWLLLGVVWWSVGSPPPPSAAGDVRGPDDLPARVALAVELDGELVVSGGTDVLYELSLGRRGGGTGAPDVLEAHDGDALAMGVVAREDSGWFRTSGWTMVLHADPTWEVDLRAGVVDLDLRTLRLGDVAIAGDGTVLLPRVGTSTDALLSGDLRVSIPADTPVRVVGDALVPASWSATGDGAGSPVAGDGWVIVVEGPGVELVDR